LLFKAVLFLGGYMSIKVMSLVWEKSQAKGKELLLMLAIADFADDWGEAFPGITRLAKKCRVSPMTVRRAMDKCVERGELYVLQNCGVETGHGKTNRYKINIDKIRGINLIPLSHVIGQGVTHVVGNPSGEPSAIPSGKNGHKTVDPIAHLLAATDRGVSESSAPNPQDQWFAYSQEFLKIFQNKTRRYPNEDEKTAISNLAAQPQADLAKWEKSLTECNLYCTAYKLTAGRVIDVYNAGGTWAAWQQKTYPQSDNGNGQQPEPQKEREKMLDPRTGEWTGAYYRDYVR
jgi:hypothetical protein